MVARKTSAANRRQRQTPQHQRLFHAPERACEDSRGGHKRQRCHIQSLVERCHRLKAILTSALILGAVAVFLTLTIQPPPTEQSVDSCEGLPDTGDDDAREQAVAEYLRRTHGWERSQFCIESQREEGLAILFGIAHRGTPQAFAVEVNPKTNEVTGELHGYRFDE
ncbi:MAG: hypothetical protein AB7E79_11360 [Rhodospirillaceae bacterium]